MSAFFLPALGCLWVTAFYAFILAIGSIALKNFLDFDSFTKLGGNKLSGVYDLGRDWVRAPFTDLEVTTELNCKPGWEPAYERIFYGLQEGCDCLFI